MWTFNKAPEGISRTDEAVCAMDGALRIIHWNKACEELLGQPARAVLGKPCYEVLSGQDANGNRYCHRNCPVAYQAREEKDHPVRPFALTVRAGGGSRTEISTSLFSIPSYHPALATLVHVFRKERTEPVKPASPLPAREPLAPIETAEGGSATLTNREQHVLACLAKGLATPMIAKGLFISPVTVRNHISNILRKLEVHTKLAAVALAHGRHLV